MHHRFGSQALERGLNSIPIHQVSFEEFRPRIDGGAVSLAQIIEYGDGVALIH